MDSTDLKAAFDRIKFGEDAFHELMCWRIRKVLLVMPHYDAWILEHDAKLSDQIVGEYHQLNLTTVPRLVTASDADEALMLLKEDSFDLMIIGMRVGKYSPSELVGTAKSLREDLAVLMLLSSRSDMAVFTGENAAQLLPAAVDASFLWSGDPRLFLAMIKYVEDLRNAPNDTVNGRVGVLLVVEDSIPFYSAYLPLVYGEMMRQTQRLIAEEMNDSDKYWRMRTRPKVLLARTWEEAVSLGETYRDALIGIVSDVAVQRNQVLDERAGFDLVDRFRRAGINVPVFFQSSNKHLAQEAEQYGARFQWKQSGDLHRGIRRFILGELGFGDFLFRDQGGGGIKRVSTLREFENTLATLPIETVIYHSDRNDYSRWMAAHGEYQVARKIKPVRSEDFSHPEEQRNFLINSFREVRESRHRGRVVDFQFDAPGVHGSVARFGQGSLGGKGRGIAFFNALINSLPWEDQFPGLKVEIPHTLIIATGEFDRFLDESGLPLEADVNDQVQQQAFLDAPLPNHLTAALEALVEMESGPLAIRSSSLLEDSQSIPFAGVYNTYMLPSIAEKSEHLRLISNAVKLVWASTFSHDAMAYRNTLGVGSEEEKMAVVIQRVAASRHESYWFPRLAGTAQSLNYYPIGPMRREDGTARIAVGLGCAIVEGDRGFLFCPRYPAIPWGTEEDRWREGQTHFWVLRTDTTGLELINGVKSTLECLTIREAERLGILRHMASTWDAVGHKLVDGLDHAGPRVVDFRDILSYEWLPLAPLLNQLLRISQTAMGTSVEIEFSLNWKGNLPEEAVFSLLQVRPLSSRRGHAVTLLKRPADESLLLRSEKSLGHGVLEGVHDVVWVDPELYDSGSTEALRDEVAALMDDLCQENRQAILIGPGRWGSRDRFLGIPVSWIQVRQARLIVEISRHPGDPEHSQGSHFFHNLVALDVGYAHVTSSTEGGFVDWAHLRRWSLGEGAVRLAHFDEELQIVMDGKSGSAWVVK